MPRKKPNKPEPTTAVKCPVCGAAPGQPCKQLFSRRLLGKPHGTRVPS